MPRVVLAGRPGAGKGTQGVRLARRLGVQYLSTGDLLRGEVATGSALGRAVERLVDAGRLIPTGLIVAIVETNLDGGGYVLDGFPRTVAQADTLFQRSAVAPTVAIEIVVPVELAFDRLTARGRRDDSPVVARERLAVYETETVPALDLLDRRGLLVRVDGHHTSDTVADNIWRAVQAKGSQLDRSVRSVTRDKVIDLTADSKADVMAECREPARDGHDAVMQRLFDVALNLHAMMGIVDEPARTRLAETIDKLDGAIRELHQTVFSLRIDNLTAHGHAS